MTNRTNPVTILILAVCASLSPSSAFSQSTEVITERALNEEIAVRLITLPVVARSAAGEPVTDLTAEEVEVVDRGVTREVAFLTPFFAGARERKNLPNVRLVTQLPNGSREVTKSTAREPRHLLILIDLENGPPTGLKDMVDELVEFLDRDVDSSFRVGVMSFDGSLNLLLPFTQNRGAVREVLQGVYTERKTRARLSAQHRLEQFINKLSICEIQEPDNQFDDDEPDQIDFLAPVADEQCLQDSVNEYAGQAIPKANAFVDSLERVVEYASGLDGHKFVLTIGGSVAFNPAREVGEAMKSLFGPIPFILRLEQSLRTDELVRPRVEELMERAFRNNVTLSFLDRSHAPSDFSARRRLIANAGFQPRLVAHQSAQEDIAELATSTGGALIAQTNVSRGLDESLALMESGYYVSFYVDDDEELDAARVNSIRIKSRRRGVSLMHRRAYAGMTGTPRSPGERVRGIIQVGTPSKQSFEGVVGNFIPLRLVIDPRDLGYAKSWEGAQAEFSVHFTVRTTDGTLLADNYHFVRHSYPRMNWDSGEIEPPAVMAWVDLPDGDYFAEAIITVPSSGRQGSTRRHIAVRGSDKPRDGIEGVARTDS